MPDIFKNNDHPQLKTIELYLSPRQYKSLDLHMKAHGKVYIWTKNGKSRIVSADEITVLEDSK